MGLTAIVSSTVTGVSNGVPAGSSGVISSQASPGVTYLFSRFSSNAVVSSSVSAGASSSTSAGASASASASAISLLSPIGLGVGGIFVAATLIFLLAYFDLFDTADITNPQLRTTLLVTIVPLLLTFAGIVLFQSLQMV